MPSVPTERLDDRRPLGARGGDRDQIAARLHVTAIVLDVTAGARDCVDQARDPTPPVVVTPGRIDGFDAVGTAEHVHAAARYLVARELLERRPE
jgi:hypothetical protein